MVWFWKRSPPKMLEGHSGKIASEVQKYVPRFLQGWREYPWFTIGASAAGAAVLMDQLMFRGVPGPIDARLTIPTTNKYIYYNAGLRMHLFHSLALMAIPPHHPSINCVGMFFMAGTALYAGSCYLYCWREVDISRKLLPIGSCFLLAGWGILFLTQFRPSMQE